MLRKLIAPVQMLLLKNGQCVGCGRLLKSGKVVKTKGEQSLIACSCGRVFVKEEGNFRRATFDEIK